MKINEKLDFLMNLTGTKNSMLSKVTSFDASYISRIRSGKRGLPKNQPFLEPIAAYFAKNIKEDYQFKAIAELLHTEAAIPRDPAQLEPLILLWLRKSDDLISDPVGGILTGISGTNPSGAKISHAQEIPEIPAPEKLPDAGLFYGNEGKRQAVLIFLSELCSMKNPPKLHLYSNEEFDWIYEDPAFAKKWAMLLMKYMSLGGRIRIIHTISRAAGEMLIALQKWIPLYMSGAIEPYFYPKLRDRIFRRTLFIACGHSAISANSIDKETSGTLNLLTFDKAAVTALEKEYDSFFALCKPLMKVYNGKDADAFREKLADFSHEYGRLIAARPTPSIYTLPDDVMCKMAERCTAPWLEERRNNVREDFDYLMASGCDVTEIINLPSPDCVREGTLEFPACDIFDQPGLFYTREEFILHLSATIEAIRTKENYHVVLSGEIPSNEILYVKEDSSAVIVKADSPSVAFFVNEPRMNYAFWEYLERITDSSDSDEHILDKLEKYIETL